MSDFPVLSDADRLERLAPPTPGRRVVIDTDTANEIDDQFALVHALLSPELKLEAVYAAPFSNAHADTPESGMEQSFDEILNVYEQLELANLPPVYKGSRRYLTFYDKPEASAATEHLVETAYASDEPLYVLALGAITNVANALLLEPDLVGRIVVVWLGGNAHHWAHTWEFNLQQDMPASSLLFDCGVPLVQLPCQGVVSLLHTTLPEVERYVKGRGKVGDFLFELFAGHAQDSRGWSKELWDTAVIAYLLNPDWLETDLRASPILNDDRVTGRKTWSFDARRHLIRYAYTLHRDPILRDLFEKLERHAARQA